MTPLVIAHRGASWDEPENTLPAFRRAIEVGADYVEFDVHATRDGMRTIQHVGFGVSVRRAGDAWGVGFANERVTPRAIARAQSAGLATTVYTVNEPARMLELVTLGVTGIFTDRPELARRTLAPPRG